MTDGREDAVTESSLDDDSFFPLAMFATAVVTITVVTYLASRPSDRPGPVVLLAAAAVAALGGRFVPVDRRERREHAGLAGTIIGVLVGASLLLRTQLDDHMAQLTSMVAAVGLATFTSTMVLRAWWRRHSMRA